MTSLNAALGGPLWIYAARYGLYLESLWPKL